MLSGPPLLLKVTVAGGSYWLLGMQQHFSHRPPKLPASGALVECVPRHTLLGCGLSAGQLTTQNSRTLKKGAGQGRWGPLSS